MQRGRRQQEQPTRSVEDVHKALEQMSQKEAPEKEYEEAKKLLLDCSAVFGLFPALEPQKFKQLLKLLIKDTGHRKTQVIQKPDDYLEVYSGEKVSEIAGYNGLSLTVSGYNVWFAWSGKKWSLCFCKQPKGGNWRG